MTSDQPGWPMGVPPTAVPPRAPKLRSSGTGGTVPPGAARASTDAGVGWAAGSLTSVAIGVLGLVGAVAAALAVPTHEDGAHGGDGAVMTLIVAVAMTWIALWSIAGFVLAMVAMNRSSTSAADGNPGQRPKIVTLSVAVAIAPFAIGAGLTAMAAMYDMVAAGTP